jgi:hypothetical protein
MGRADDGHAEAPLERRQRQLGGQSLDLPEADLLARTVWLDAMQVGMDAQLDLAAGRA